MLGREGFACGTRYSLVLSHIWEGLEPEATAGLGCQRGHLTGCPAWAAHTPSPLADSTEAGAHTGSCQAVTTATSPPAPLGKHWTWALTGEGRRERLWIPCEREKGVSFFCCECLLPCLGTHAPEGTHTSAPAPRKCLLSGERQEQAGSLVGRGQGLTPGLALKVGRCFRSCYLPPPILNPATWPPSPALPQGHLARPPEGKDVDLRRGSST